MHHPTDRITHTTAFVTPVVEHWLEREIAQWVHPMKDRRIEGGGGGAHRHVIYVPSVKNQYKRVVFGYMVIY